MAQISLAWILSKPGVSAPIIGTTKLSNLEDILGESLCSAESVSLYREWGTDAPLFEGCFDVTLTEEEIKYLEEPYQPTRIIGHQ